MTSSQASAAPLREIPPRIRKRAMTVLRARRPGASDLGKLLIDRMLDEQLTVTETAKRMHLHPDTVDLLIDRRGYRPFPVSREAAAEFLGLTDVDVARFLGLTIVICDGCGQEFLPKHRGTGVRKFCSNGCHDKWANGRSKYQRPAAAVKRKPWRRSASGREKAARMQVAGRPSITWIASTHGFSYQALYTVKSRRRGRLISLYALEKYGYLRPRPRPALTVAILEHCLNKKMKPYHFFQNAGVVSAGAHGRILRTGRADTAVLEKLARAMERPLEELSALSPARGFSWFVALLLRPTRPPSVDQIVGRVLERYPDEDPMSVRRLVETRVRAKAPKRAPGRPGNWTPDQLRQVVGWREETPPVPWTEIGRRLGWSVKRDVRGNPTDCRRARNAYAAARLHTLN